MQLLHRHLEQGLRCRLDRAVAPHLLRFHLGVAGRSGSRKPCELDLPGSPGTPWLPLPDRCRRLRHALPGELVVLYCWHLDMDVDTIQEGSGEAALVAQD